MDIELVDWLYIAILICCPSTTSVVLSFDLKWNHFPFHKKKKLVQKTSDANIIEQVLNGKSLTESEPQR